MKITSSQIVRWTILQSAFMEGEKSFSDGIFSTVYPEIFDENETENINFCNNSQDNPVNVSNGKYIIRRKFEYCIFFLGVVGFK